MKINKCSLRETLTCTIFECLGLYVLIFLSITVRMSCLTSLLMIIFYVDCKTVVLFIYFILCSRNLIYSFREEREII